MYSWNVATNEWEVYNLKVEVLFILNNWEKKKFIKLSVMKYTSHKIDFCDID